MVWKWEDRDAGDIRVRLHGCQIPMTAVVHYKRSDFCSPAKITMFLLRLVFSHVIYEFRCTFGPM